MRILLFCLLSFLIILQACSNNGGNKIPERIAFKQNPMDSVYSKLRPALQFFTIDNTKAIVVKAANGTEILVPANCFINSSGDAAGNVQLEVVEAFSLQDFVTSGLATVSGDKLLISNGMMYVNAKSGDAPLQLSKGAALTVSMPTMGNRGDAGFQMFTGDGSNWTADSTMTAIDYTIPLPLNLLYPEGNKYLFDCITNVGDPDERYAYMDTTIVSVTDKKYENTVIATMEFKYRYYALRSMTEEMSYFINRDYYFDKVDCMNEKHNYDLFKVYYDHPERSFRESDSIAKKMYIDYFTANEQKIADFCEEVNQHKRTYYSNWTDTNYYFDFRKISLKDNYMNVLNFFPPANSKEIKRINDHGVNLDTANAYELLKQKGIAAGEINDLLSYAFRRRSMIQQLQNEDAAANQAKLSKTYESTVFSVTTMGWINCDRFYDDPTAGKAAMYVSNSSGKQLDFIDCSLVIPDMNVRLTGFPDNTGTYSFTQKDGRYTKLPIGRAAVIVGVSMQHDSLFFASKKINITDGLKISLPMGYTTVKGLKDSLVVALK
jgi:hypothetical protein